VSEGTSKQESPVCKLCVVSDCDNKGPDVKYCSRFREQIAEVKDVEEI